MSDVNKSKLPHYSFGDVKGAMLDSTDFSMNWGEQDVVDIEFDYLDRHDGVVYHVVAKGYRTPRKDRSAMDSFVVYKDKTEKELKEKPKEEPEGAVKK